MKITLNPHHCTLEKESLGVGSHSFASYERIVLTMITSGELRIDPDKIITGISIQDNGISFLIEKK